MKTGICSGFFAAIVLLTGTAWASVSTDYDLRVDFSRYKTYSWKHVQTADRTCDQRVKEAIEVELEGIGWTQVPSGGDVLVSAIAVTRPEQMRTSTPWGGFGGYGGGFGPVIISGQRFGVGTLVVDMFDGTSNLLVLRAVAPRTIPSRPRETSKKLDSEVRKMFKHFPASRTPHDLPSRRREQPRGDALVGSRAR